MPLPSATGPAARWASPNGRARFSCCSPSQPGCNADIGRALYISVDTVKTHLRHGFRKLDVRTRSEAVALIMRDPAFRLWER